MEYCDQLSCAEFQPCPLHQPAPVRVKREVDPQARFASLLPLLNRTGPFAREGFEALEDNLNELQDKRILVVGAGGLGCEILKDLALSGFCNLHVVDMDTIDVSNLNRQFLFRIKDVNKNKSEVAAAFIMNRCPWVKCQAHVCDIMQKPKTWYRQFDLVISGLDNIEARVWLNETLLDLVEIDPESNEMDWDTAIPMIDGGTEGFNGQTRMFVPRVNACFTCGLQSLADQTTFAICTIRNVPRTPEHCISYALKFGWPRLYYLNTATDYKIYEPKNDQDEFAPSGATLDKDNTQHMTWLYNYATQRAAKFNISGVTYSLTMQVVKNIIPAIASTNALISAACVNEAFKYLSGTSQRLNNYMMYMGGKATGINSELFRYLKNPECKVCHELIVYKLDPNVTTLGQVVELLEKGVGCQKPLGLINTCANQLTNAAYLLRTDQQLTSCIKGLNVLEVPLTEMLGKDRLFNELRAAQLMEYRKELEQFTWPEIGFQDLSAVKIDEKDKHKIEALVSKAQKERPPDHCLLSCSSERADIQKVYLMLEIGQEGIEPVTLEA